MLVMRENNRGATVVTFRAMIEDTGLAIVVVHDCEPQRTPDDRFYCRRHAQG